MQTTSATSRQGVPESPVIRTPPLQTASTSTVDAIINFNVPGEVLTDASRATASTRPAAAATTSSSPRPRWPARTT
ncbi:hypothetical protein PR002_g24479 [Phytophthora rubi]|uniref:Uncharacterized protein n=1 Tax=Phytophthora rubi TaxID=129364 RepID=A0A6A3IHN5_9STRA|nr:hypothetical protein PR002_g24479 [Phytophthora rubi]